MRVLPSFGSNTLTSAGSAARNPQKFATPLYLNAASRTAFAVGERRADGLCLGEVTATDLQDRVCQQGLLSTLAGAYAGLDGEFRAPYVDLVG